MNNVEREQWLIRRASLVAITTSGLAMRRHRMVRQKQPCSYSIDTALSRVTIRMMMKRHI
jgi:hypothetical protein